MSAKVKPNPNGGRAWVAYCPEHSAHMVGTMAQADLWADVHNDENHPEESK